MTHRTRAWRRAKARHRDGRCPKSTPRPCWREKAWRHLYFRSAKLKRAQSLGLIWPHRAWEDIMADAEPIRVLFVCSMNERRSLTAEKVFEKDVGLDVRSAGTVRGSRRTLGVEHLRWADVILVMEEKHEQRIRAHFRDEVRYKRLHVLGVPDEYAFMDDELVALLRERAEPLIWNDR